MTMKKLLPQGLIILALVSGISVLSVTPAQAIAYDYTVTGTVIGTFNADLSVAGGSFNSWSLTTPVATFTNLTGTVFSNTNFALFQTLGINAFSFLVEPPPATNSYSGIYSGGIGAGSFSGSFTQAAASLPLPGTASLVIVGMLILLACSRWLPLRCER